MATYDYDSLKNEYKNFYHPVTVISVNGKDISSNKAGLIVSDIDVELTSGFEASIASFVIYNGFNNETSEYRIDEVKKYVSLGSLLEIALGYGGSAKAIFCGFISKVNFFYEEHNAPGIRVTAMDVKGIMMANNYSKQLKADSYGEAVQEILNENAYLKMANKDIIKKLEISDTPDKKQSGGEKKTERTIEMVSESDYEFVVKAAKKYNFEFFTRCGVVFFRKAKSNADVLLELGPATGLRYYDVEYDITGLAETVEARGMDVGKAKLIQSKSKFSNKISIGNKAMPFIKKSKKIYIDATVASQQEADYRAQSILEEMSFRFGTLECTTIGIPELMPGNYIKLTGLGHPPENEFYLVSVRHTLSEDRGFETRLIGRADKIK